MALPKWTDERTQSLVDFVGDGPVSQAQVAEAADMLETSTRSVSSKLRKMGYDVELASASASKSFSEEQEATLRNFVTDNSGSYTYAEIASNFEGGNFSAKSIQGKYFLWNLQSMLSLLLNQKVLELILLKKKQHLYKWLTMALS